MSESINLGPQDSPFVGLRGSLPEDFRERVKYVSKMAQGVAVAGPDAIGKEIDVRYWLVHPTEKVDDHTGEVTPAERLILSDGNGLVISTSSGVALQAWNLIAGMLGDGPYDPPMRVALREGRARSGNKFTTLVAVD